MPIITDRKGKKLSEEAIAKILSARDPSTPLEPPLQGTNDPIDRLDPLPTVQVPTISTYGVETANADLSCFQLKEMLFAAQNPHKRPLRPLHHEVLLQHKICIVEDANMHLVWQRTIMDEGDWLYLKPIPRQIMSLEFWHTDMPLGTFKGTQRDAYEFLRAYKQLIKHKSDLRIAKNIGLVSKKVKFKMWEELMNRLSTYEHLEEVSNRPRCVSRIGGKETVYYSIRSCYLDLTILSHLESLGLCGDEQKLYQSYNRAHFSPVDWMNNHLGLLAVVFIYFSIVLAAFQVGLALPNLQNSHAFSVAAYVMLMSCMVLCLLALAYGVFTTFGYFISTRWYSWVVKGLWRPIKKWDIWKWGIWTWKIWRWPFSALKTCFLLFTAPCSRSSRHGFFVLLKTRPRQQMERGAWVV